MSPPDIHIIIYPALLEILVAGKRITFDQPNGSKVQIALEGIEGIDLDVMMDIISKHRKDV